MSGTFSTDGAAGGWGIEAVEPCIVVEPVVELCIVVEPFAEPFSIGSGVALRKSRCPVFSISCRNRSSWSERRDRDIGETSPPSTESPFTL
jgi:hypothetical protein